MRGFVLQYPTYGLLLLIPVFAGGIILFFFFQTKRDISLLIGGLGFKEDSFSMWYLLKEGSCILALSFVVLSTMGFAWGTTVVEEDRKGLDLVFLLDISRSMLARDVPPNRLEAAKSLAKSLVSTLPDTRFGVVVYRGTAVQSIPLTEDRLALESFLREVHPNFLQSRGTNLTEGLKQALNSFSKQGDRQGVVLLLSDGESPVPVPTSLLRLYQNEGIPIYAVGLGTVEGSVIQDPALIRHRDGRPVVSRLDKPGLIRVTEMTGGAFFAYADSPLDRILWDRLQQYRKELETPQYRFIPAERYDLFLAFAIFFLCTHILVRSIPWGLN